MPNRYKTAAAFRQALQERLKGVAAQRRIPLNTLRLNVTIERLLARLFASPNPPWLLKGGYAMELRYRPHARATTDVDLSVSSAAAVKDRILQIREHLQEAASRDLADFFVFRIGAAYSELQGAPMGGARFPVDALVAGKRFAQFHVDVGIGDALTGEPERLAGDDVLGFAGITPATVRAVPKAQQFAEKLHALTFPWSDRPNTRTKDLVDLILLMAREQLELAEVRDAVRRTFETRGTHAVPQEIPLPPDAWTKEFAAMAEETAIDERDLLVAHRRLVEFWTRVWPG
ncbi:MAG: nucleotidyl transferase AbiEii/AbiGii toxin family protein [Phycisphaerales bacterium]|nr:nucleotidyl transferase AbiEii/AbiGii toxin family protein [Phycisphaerales bacterium]